jgi:hypothetical protein
MARPSCHRPPPAAGGPAAASGEAWLAEALCDLVAGPESGITRVRVIGTTPRFAREVAAVAAARRLPARLACSAALGRAWVELLPRSSAACASVARRRPSSTA